MKILVLSSKGHGLGVAMRLRQEGHKVILKTSNPYEEIGQGLIERETGSLRKITTNKLDYVIAFGARFGDLSAYFLERDYPVIGSSPFSEMMELSSEYRATVLGYLKQEGNVVDRTNGKIACAWFDGKRFLSTCYSGYAHKRLFPGEIGPVVACSGATLSQDPSARCNFTQGLSRSLQAARYVGPVLAHEGIISSYMYPGVTECMLTGLQQPVGNFFDHLIRGNAKIRKTSDWFVTVHISIPPYPHRTPKAKEIPLRGSSFDKGLKYMWLEDAKWDGELVCAGTSGSIGYVSAHGRCKAEAMRRAYRCIERMDIPELQYRSDIGKGA